MKLVLAAVLCAMTLNVMSMPVAEPGVPEPLAVVPLEKDVPVAPTQHVLRRESEPVVAPAAPVAAAPAVSEHHEGETAEEHAAHAHLSTRADEKPQITEHHEGETAEEHATHAHLTARSDDKLEKISEPAVKSAEPILKQIAGDKIDEKKEDKKEVGAVKSIVIEEAAEVSPAEVPPAVPVAPVEVKPEPVTVEGKSAQPQKEAIAESKEEPKPTEAIVKPIEENQPIAKSAPIAETAAPIPEAPKEEKKVEAVVAEEKKEVVKGESKAEDKTDRVTRGTGTPAESAAPVQSSFASESAPIPEVAAATAEIKPEEKKDEKLSEPAAKLEAVIAEEKKPEASPIAPVVAEVEEKAVEEPQPSENKADEPQVKSVPPAAETEIQPKPEAIAPTTEIKAEPVAETIKAKSEVIEPSKESIVEATKAEDSSEEKSSEESAEKSAEVKSIEGEVSEEMKKEEPKAEELPKPEQLKEN